jgi:hypothetical protein
MKPGTLLLSILCPALTAGLPLSAAEANGGETIDAPARAGDSAETPARRDARMKWWQKVV